MIRMINYKAIGIIITISCSMTYTMEFEHLLPWFLVKRLYPDKTEQATQACKEVTNMFRTAVLFSLDPKRQPYKEELINDLRLVIKVCDIRKEAIDDGAYESNNARIQKVLRLGDYYLVKGWEPVEQHFNLLQKLHTTKKWKEELKKHGATKDQDDSSDEL